MTAETFNWGGMPRQLACMKEELSGRRALKGYNSDSNCFPFHGNYCNYLSDLPYMGPQLNLYFSLLKSNDRQYGRGRNLRFS